MSQVQRDITDNLKHLGGAWTWMLAFGLIAIASGLSMFLFTGAGLLLIAITFGVWLVIGGIHRFAATFSVPQENGWVSALYALVSMVSVAAGVYLIAHPVLSVLVLTLTVGLFWMLSGMAELFAGIEMRGFPHRGWLIAGGALGVIGGWIITFWPGISAVALALLLGFWLVVYGITAVAASLRLRSVTRPLRAVLRSQHV